MIDNRLQKKRYAGLRKQAKDSIESGSLTLSELTAEQQESITDLVEELRIYEAELEIQNDTLRVTQRQLEASQALYQELFSSLPVAVFVLSGQGVIQQLNLQAMSLFGSSQKSRLVHHSIYRLLEANSAQSLAKVIASNSLGIQSFDVEIVTSHGVKTFDSFTVRLPSEAENIFSFNYIFMLVDKSVELEKRNQSRLFESIINNSPTLIFALDRDNKCILANNETLNFFGEKTLNEVLGKNPESLIEDTSGHSLFESSGRIYSSGKAEQNEHVISINDSSHTLLVNQFPLKNINNEIYAISTIATDITSQKKNEAKLKLALQIFSQGQEGIMICNAQAEIISVNKAFEQITGFSEHEVFGRNPSFLASGKQDKQFYRHMWSTIINKGHWEGEIWNKRKNGELFPQWINISKSYDDESNVTNYLGVFTDITAQKEHLEQINRLAFYDALTGTANRILLKEHFALMIRQKKDATAALLFLDLDHFKEVNDVYGHDIGDELLCQVTNRIKPLIRESDTLCRLGGDEFAMLLNDIDEEEVSHKASHLISILAQPYEVGGRFVNISASMGIAMYPKHASKYEDLLKFADVSMYQAKNQGRNAFAFFESSMAAIAEQQMSLDTALRQAIELEQFELYFQPQLDAGTHQVIGFEALLRWSHPTFGNVSPDVFIPIAEKSDLIVDITNWVIKHAMLAMHEFDNTCFKGCRISVNISGRDFSQGEFIERISTLLQKHPNINASRLELELTERITMRSPENTLRVLQELKRLDIRVAIDDFGTGYSSLNYLKTYPIDVIKIDRSFVEEILSNKKDFGVCHTIVNLAKALEMEVVAEGVETAEQNAILKSLGCDFVQGYFYSKPKPLSELKCWVLKA